MLLLLLYGQCFGFRAIQQSFLQKWSLYTKQDLKAQETMTSQRTQRKKLLGLNWLEQIWTQCTCHLYHLREKALHLFLGVKQKILQLWRLHVLCHYCSVIAKSKKVTVIEILWAVLLKWDIYPSLWQCVTMDTGSFFLTALDILCMQYLPVTLAMHGVQQVSFELWICTCADQLFHKPSMHLKPN